MAKRKQVGPEHLGFLKTYFSKKLVEEGGLSSLMNEVPAESAEAELRDALEQEDTHELNTWFDRYLSDKGRRVIWTAFRNVEYRERNPRSKQELRKSLVDQVMAWAEGQGIDNLNDAVEALLEAQQAS